MKIDRRTAVGLMGLGVLASKVNAAHEHLNAMRANPDSYKLQFFQARENQLLDRVAEMILPADDHSPGAHEARVSYFIDLLAAHSGEKAKAAWKSRLAAFEKMARDRFGKPFADLTKEDQSNLLDALAAHEDRPPDEAARFFVDMKKATLFAYYTSPTGLLRELQYAGNKAVAEFAGCPGA
jgi:hypothetical protein